MASIESMETEEGRKPIWVLTYPSTFDQASELSTIEEVSDWSKELIDYLESGILPSEKEVCSPVKYES
jgi:hypothetical protein